MIDGSLRICWEKRLFTDMQHTTKNKNKLIPVDRVKGFQRFDSGRNVNTKARHENSLQIWTLPLISERKKTMTVFCPILSSFCTFKYLFSLKSIIKVLQFWKRLANNVLKPSCLQPGPPRLISTLEKYQLSLLKLITRFKNSIMVSLCLGIYILTAHYLVLVDIVGQFC